MSELVPYYKEVIILVVLHGILIRLVYYTTTIKQCSLWLLLIYKASCINISNKLSFTIQLKDVLNYAYKD